MIAIRKSDNKKVLVAKVRKDKQTSFVVSTEFEFFGSKEFKDEFIITKK